MNKLLSPGPVWQEGGIAIARMITGFFMVYHGWELFDANKMNSYLEWDLFKTAAGKTLVYTGKAAEWLGGLLLFLGLFTRIAVGILVATMGYITFIVGHGKIWYEDQHSFLFVVLGLVFFVTGPGAWSLDRSFFGKNKQRT